MVDESTGGGIHVDKNDAGELPASERIGKASDMFWVWGGVNVAVGNLAAGGLGIAIGLSLVDVLLVYLIGGAVGALLMGAAVLQGKLTGAATMVNARPSYGYRGAYLMAALLFLMSCGWFGVNTFFGMTAARSAVEQFGGGRSSVVSVLTLVVLVAAQLLIAVYGYDLIRRFERIAVATLIVALCVLAVFALPNFQWQAAEPLQGSARVGMIVFLVTILGVGWAISWAPWGHDFGRYVSPAESNKKTFWLTWAGFYVVNFFVMSLGAGVASYGSSALDAGAMVTQVLGNGWSVPILFVMTLAPITQNVVVLFGAGFALQTMNVRLSRAKGTVLAGLLGLPIPIVGIFSGSFFEIFDQWMLTLLIWITPWLAITLVDFFLINGGSYTHTDLYETWRTRASRVFAPGLVAYFVGIVASLPFASTPLWTSPLVSTYLAGADLSYWVGGAVAALVYYPWARASKAGAPTVGEKRSEQASAR